LQELTGQELPVVQDNSSTVRHEVFSNGVRPA